MDTDIEKIIAQLMPTMIANIQREYPNGIIHHFVTEGERLEGAPSTVHPAFYGCYDWHSAVEGHWFLVRAMRLFPATPLLAEAVAVINRHLTPENLATELAYVTARPSFEMPYGMAWFLQLMVELREQAGEPCKRWQALLTPLERHAVARLHAYLTRLPYPIRTGLHSQTAFGMALAWDWAKVAGDEELRRLIDKRARDFFGNDRNAPFAYEPSGSDFLSPTLAEADLMRRVLPAEEFHDWLSLFMGEPALDSLAALLRPVGVVDYADGQLAHFSGLNISRAWMLRGIASALPADNPRKALFEVLAQEHQTFGLPVALHADYAVSHWAPTYVIYLLTNRGLYETDTHSQY